jgi:glyoxylase-like metal-dependent hydrolase (beta-lactamase superfamily II)
MPGEVTSLRDGRLQLIKIGRLGYNSNNVYIIADTTTNDAIVIDAPEGSEQTIEGAKPFNVKQIVMTHRHRDHWAGIDVLKAGIDVPVLTHELDREPWAQHVGGTLGQDDEVTVGSLKLRVLHTPGHTAGCICLSLGEHLIAGDVLFPGGPGRTASPEALATSLNSITSSLYVLPDNTHVYPGHGANTTIGASKAEYAVFASKQHAPDLAGDVNWLTS